jgi:hypothetical protein
MLLVQWLDDPVAGDRHDPAIQRRLARKRMAAPRRFGRGDPIGQRPGRRVREWAELHQALGSVPDPIMGDVANRPAAGRTLGHGPGRGVLRRGSDELDLDRLGGG